MAKEGKAGDRLFEARPAPHAHAALFGSLVGDWRKNLKTIALSISFCLLLNSCILTSALKTVKPQRQKQAQYTRVYQGPAGQIALAGGPWDAKHKTNFYAVASSTNVMRQSILVGAPVYENQQRTEKTPLVVNEGTGWTRQETLPFHGTLISTNAADGFPYQLGSSTYTLDVSGSYLDFKADNPFYGGKIALYSVARGVSAVIDIILLPVVVFGFFLYFLFTGQRVFN